MELLWREKPAPANPHPILSIVPVLGAPPGWPSHSRDIPLGMFADPEPPVGVLS